MVIRDLVSKGFLSVTLERHKTINRPVHILKGKLSFIFVGFRNDRFFLHTNPYISNVTQQCRCSPMLIFRTWATCDFIDLFDNNACFSSVFIETWL